jgi:hypothetical protein
VMVDKQRIAEWMQTHDREFPVVVWKGV